MSEKISDRVALAINESGLDNDEIAKLVKKSESTVYRWRNKETTNYPKTTLKSIADALQVNYEWLRFGEGERTNNEKLNRIRSKV